MLEQFETVNRPWGRFAVVLQSDFFWVKFLQVKPKQRTSLQSHQRRTEQWTVIKGKCVVEVEQFGKTELLRVYVRPGGRFEIKPNTLHRITNASDDTSLLIMEHAFGEPDEEDIFRAEDDYGRAQEPMGEV